MVQATKKRRGSSRKPPKARLRKPAAPKRGRAAGASRAPAATASELRHQLEQRARELKEARDQQAATSEVLSIIARSPGDLKSVFGAILKNATRLCDAKFGNLLLYENGAFRRVALYGAPRAWAEATNRQPVIPHNAVNPLFRIVRTRQVVHIPDMKAEQVYLDGAPDVVGMVEQSGARTIAAVPMIRDGELVGAIAIYRQQVRPFTDKQIEVVKNFAAEAVIAIENARLFEAEQQRTRELTEALEQQTATAEVLRVISNSLSKLDSVFDTILANATKLCAAHFGMLALHEDGAFRSVAMHNVPQAFAEQRLSGPIRFAPEESARAAGGDESGAARRRRQDGSGLSRWRPRHHRTGPPDRRAHPARRADAQGRQPDRRLRHLPSGSAPLYRQADRARHELRQSGRHRHRECAAAERVAPAHERPDRVAGAADGHDRGPSDHQQLARRS